MLWMRETIQSRRRDKEICGSKMRCIFSVFFVFFFLCIIHHTIFSQVWTKHCDLFLFFLFHKWMFVSVRCKCNLPHYHYLLSELQVQVVNSFMSCEIWFACEWHLIDIVWTKKKKQTEPSSFWAENGMWHRIIFIFA